ncbi:MAG: hypothetical protein U1A07_20500 [Phenylobacterium sp.]|nr:hypothetical protein [Phenylobacterium sp.]MDZ4053960.1 hypothetical protein [Phenylobacterium sp.]MDZ4321187.1 hypothetical protein [Phenylobacterium sp.]
MQSNSQAEVLAGLAIALADALAPDAPALALYKIGLRVRTIASRSHDRQTREVLFALADEITCEDDGTPLRPR